MPRGFIPGSEGRVGRPASLQALARQLDGLREKFASERQRQHAAQWSNEDLAAVLAELKRLAAPFEAEQFDRWQRETEQD